VHPKKIFVQTEGKGIFSRFNLVAIGSDKKE